MEEMLFEHPPAEQTEAQAQTEAVPQDTGEAENAVPEEESLPPLTDTDYERIAAEDLSVLKAQFPALAALSSLVALPNPSRYAELRELGLSPAEAYLATGSIARKKSDNRAHLRSAVPRMGAVSATALTAEEMAEARRLFSDLSDAQIHRLYKKVMN